jgi:hypothetical protein
MGFTRLSKGSKVQNKERTTDLGTVQVDGPASANINEGFASRTHRQPECLQSHRLPDMQGLPAHLAPSLRPQICHTSVRWLLVLQVPLRFDA